MAKKYEYFARKEAKDVVTFLEEQCFDLVRSRTEYWEMLRRNFKAYYSNNIFGDELRMEDSALAFRGERGELIKVTVNQARTLTKQFIGIVGKQRLAFEAIASTTESSVLDNSRLENAILENMVDDKKLDIIADNALEMSMVLGSAYLAVTWDASKGYAFGADLEAGELLMSGDVQFEVFSPFDVYFDHFAKSFGDLDWIVLKRRLNKADLIALHPEIEEELSSYSADSDYDEFQSYVFNEYGENENMVCVYEFYHKPTAAMPKGRLTAFVNKDIVVFDGENPYECLPVSQLMPETVINTMLGYPMFSELLPLNEMLSSSMSTIASNQAAFGVQSVLIPKGSDINVTDIGNLKFINFTPQNAQGGGKPEALQLVKTPSEIFQFADMLHKHLVEISGLNGAIRGTPPAGVTSGVALSALATNAIEFAQGATRAYSICLEHAALIAMKAIRKFATEEQVVFMVGRNKETIAKKFKGSDLKDLYKVRLRMSNPLAKTAGGRITMTEQMLANGLIKTPEEYFSVLQTGNIEQIMESSVDEKSLIKAENDKLTDGGMPIAISMDSHARHIFEHRALLFNPNVRESSELTQRVLTHILEHVELAKQTDPFIMAIIETGRLPQLPPEAAPPEGAAPETGQQLAPPGEVPPLEAGDEELPGAGVM